MLLETVESVLRGNEVPTELVIVDQSDTPSDRLSNVCSDRACNVRYLWSRTRGLSRARNIAISAARHEIVAIIDDDMFVAGDWFGALIRALVRQEDQSVITGRVLSGDAEVTGGFVLALVSGENSAVYKGRINTDVLAGGHMAARRSTLLQLGGFDERLGAGARFPAADDNDFGFRLLQSGYCIVFAPEAVVYHRAWRPLRDYPRMRWNYGKGKGGFYAKYVSCGDRHMLRRMTWDITHRIVLFPRRLRYERHRALGDIVYVLGILYGFVDWLLTQRKTS